MLLMMPFADPEQKRAYHRAYKRANRWRYRARDRIRDAAVHANRRAVAYGVRGTLTPEDVAAVIAAGRCVYCGSSKLLGIDHVVPMAAGGPNLPTNIVAACRSCNASKWRGTMPGRWARDHDACRAYGEATRKHVARGFCGRCYQREAVHTPGPRAS